MGTLRAIIEASLRFRLLILAAAAAALVVGASQLHKMPVDVLPEYVPPTVEIQTEALGLSAAEVEQLITVPMEQDLLAGVAFLEDMRSESLPGLSRIFLVFEPGTDLFIARQVVAERLTQAHALPNVSKPPQMLQPLSSTNRALIVAASSKKLSPIEMGVMARWTVAPRLIGVPGVANVSIWGFRDRQLQVQIDPERLRDSGVSLIEVIETAGNALWFSPLTFVEASTPGTGGFIDTPNQRLGVQHLSPLNSAADLAKVRLVDDGPGKRVLGDVASVVEDHQPLIGDALVGDGDGDLLFVVEKLPEANTLDVTHDIEDTIEALAPGLSGVEFDTTVYRPASYLDRAIDSFKVGMAIGALLLALAVAAFFLRWRSVLVALLAIPLPLVVATLVLWAFGTTMNAMILVGLVVALALVVDDVLCGVDDVVRRLGERTQATGASTAAIIRDATLETRSVAAYGTLVVALALLPVFFMNGLVGAFLPDVAGAFLVALAASMAVALTVTPALSVLVLSRASLERTSPVADRLRRTYARALAWVVPRARFPYLATAAVAVAACIAVPFLSFSLLPTLKEEQVLIRWNGAPGTSLPEMNRITALASKELRSIDGVRDVGAHIGRAVGSDLSANANTAELWVSIDPSSDYDATIGSVKRVIGGYPGLSQSVESFSTERAKTALEDGPARDVVVRVYGENPAVLQQQAARVEKAIVGVEGIADPSIEVPALEPTVEVEVDLAAARANGVKPGDVRRAAATLLGGLVVGNLFEQQKVFEVVVWGTPETRSSLTSIRQLLIDTPDGRHVRLGRVADVRVAPNPAVIKRQAVSRYLDVGASVSGRSRGDVVSDVKGQLASLRFPLEYHTEVLDASGQPLGRLLGLGLAAAVGIFLLLQACFGSWRLAALCFLSFPLAIAGGLLAALADGGTLSFGSLIALFAVFGLAARHGMLLVDRCRQLELEGKERFGVELVVRAARERVVPVVLTTVAAGLALLPFVVRGGIAGYELVHSAAVVMIGGLVTSALLVLFVVPVLYLRFATSAVALKAAPAEELVSSLLPAPAAAATATPVLADEGDDPVLEPST